MSTKNVIFVEKPSSHLYCPLCDEILQDPVISVACGHTFCRTCLCQTDGTVKITNCPLDKTFIQNGQTVDNRAILSQIEDLKVYCRNGIKRLNSRNDTVVIQNGCPEILSFSSAEDHVCQYAETECPNSPQCGKFKKGELADHVSHSCRFLNCPNGGCTQKGTLVEIREHQRVCPFFMLQMTASRDDMDDTISTLNQKVSYLEQSKTSIEICLLEQRNMIQTLEKKLLLLEADVQVNRNRIEGSSGRQRGTSSMTGQRLSLSSSFDHGHGSSREFWRMPFEFKCIGTLRGHQGAVHCLAIHRDKLYSGGSDCVIKVWNLLALSKGCIQELKGHTKQVVALVAGPRHLYSTSLDMSIRSWPYDSGQIADVKIVKHAHEQDICSLIMAGAVLFSSSKSEVKIWKADTLELVKVISGLHHWVRALALDPLEENLYCGSHNTVTVWDATTQFNMKKKMDHNFGSVYSLAVSNKFLLVGTYNHNCKVFDVHSHRLLFSCDDHIGTVTDMFLSPDQNFLVTSCHDLKVRIYHLENFLSVQVLARHFGSVNCLAFKSTKGILCSGSDDQEIKIFTYFPLTTHSAYGIHV